MVDKPNVAFLDDGYYEEIVVGEEMVGETAEEVITDHYVTEDGHVISSAPGQLDGNLLTLSDGHHTIVTTSAPGVEHQQLAQQVLVQPHAQQTQQVIQQQMEEQNMVDQLPRPKHERCRCEARLYVHYHCAICAKPFAMSCMLKHFQHLHYAPGTVKTTYAHLIDEDRELYGVISYSQLTPNPAHVIKLANGSKRCSNSVCKAKRREGSIEECEHCVAVEDGPASAPEPIFIDQQILDNCHKDFVESYKQYCNSAAQHGVPAVCVLRAPPHVTSHIIYSCFNENNIQKRYLVVQYEPTISCSCGVGAEKACWHRAIVSLCCQAPGQSDNDSLDPPFETLFSVREMQRFIQPTEATPNILTGRTPKPSGSRRSKVAKLSSDHHHHHHQFDPQGINNNSSNNPSGLLGRDSAEIEHAQLLSELGGGGAMQQTHAHLDTQNVLQSMSSVGVAAQQALMIPSAVESGIPTHPHLGGTSGAMMGQGSLEYMAAAGSGVNFASAPEMLIAINRLNDTIDSLRAEIVSLKSQVADSSKFGSRYREEGLYTISVKGPHTSKSTLEDLSRKQARVVVPSFDVQSKTGSTGGPGAAGGVAGNMSEQGQDSSGGFTVGTSQHDQGKGTRQNVGDDIFEEISEDENDPNRALPGNRGETGSGSDTNGRPRRQLQPNRLYNGKEFLTDSNKPSNAPFKPKSN